MRQLIGIGDHGKMVAFGTMKELQLLDKNRRDAGERPVLTPHHEGKLDSPVMQNVVRCDCPYALFAESNWRQLLGEHIANMVYRSPAYYGPEQYGPWGDAFSVTVCDEMPYRPNATYSHKVPIILNWIGRKEFPAGKLAADIVVFVEQDRECYFVGIRRRNFPGKGEPATIGGFLDVNGKHLSTPIETVLHEAPEEAGITITARDRRVVRERELLSRKIHPVDVVFGRDTLSGPFEGRLKYLGVWETGPEDDLQDGTKRVHWAFGYLLVVRVPKDIPLTEEMLSSMLSAGDDASDIYVCNLGNWAYQTPDPKLFSSHHQRIFASALQEYRRISGSKFPLRRRA